MIILPNGDEIGLNYDGIKEIEVETIKDLVHYLINYSKKDYGKCTFAYYKPKNGRLCCDQDKIFNIIAKSSKKLEFCNVYEMTWGEIIVSYTSTDNGGYDSINKLTIFPNKEEYNKSVML